MYRKKLDEGQELTYKEFEGIKYILNKILLFPCKIEYIELIDLKNFTNICQIVGCQLMTLFVRRHPTKRWAEFCLNVDICAVQCLELKMKMEIISDY